MDQYDLYVARLNCRVHGNWRCLLDLQTSSSQSIDDPMRIFGPLHFQLDYILVPRNPLSILYSRWRTQATILFL